MLSWITKRRKAGSDATRVGLSLEGRQLSLVACQGELEGRPRIVAWDSVEIDEPGDLPLSIRRFVEQNGLESQACRCTLAPEDYSLRLVERPTNVPDEELVDATRWLIRDLVEFDIEQAQLAIFTLPDHSSRARTPRMFVIAARQEPIQILANAITEAGLELEGIDIIETAMLSLESRMAEVVAGGAVLRTHEKTSVMTLSFEERLYLARNLSIDSESIESAAIQALEDPSVNNSEVMDLLDPLLLEIQRSLDYYESEYGQAPASRLALLPSAVDMGPLVPVLSEALRPLQIETFELERYFEVEEPPPSSIQAALAIPAGAATSSGQLIGDALLPSGFKTREGGFGLMSVGQLAAGIVLLASVLYAVESFQLATEKAVLAQVELERDTIRSQIEGFRATQVADPNGVDPQAEIDTLEALRDARLRTLRDLQQGGSKTGASFSGLLEGLARQDLDGIWLERIELSGGGDAVTIEGRTLHAQDLPSFLRGLGTETSFADRRFRTFQVERPKDATPGLAFRIATLDSTSSAASGSDSAGGDR